MLFLITEPDCFFLLYKPLKICCIKAYETPTHVDVQLVFFFVACIATLNILSKEPHCRLDNILLKDNTNILN